MRLSRVGQRLAREGIELLDADDRGVRVARRVARLHQVVGDLARAQDEPLASSSVGGALGSERMRLEMAVADEVVGAATRRACAAAATWAS